MAAAKKRRAKGRQVFVPGVAPDELLVDDFRVLDSRETLRCAWGSEQNLLVQSVLGHAHEGHGVFKGRRFVNTTMDDIARALRLDPVAVREERQALIDGVEEYCDRVLSGGDGSVLVDDDGAPLLSMGTLALLPPVDGPAVLRGFYLGAMRDESEARIGAEKRYGFAVGGGDGYLVDLKTMVAAGLDADKLAHQDHSPEEIARLREIGVIVGDEGPDGDGISYEYIRHRRGCGTSDDACVVICGLLHGFSAGIGAFLADAVDTLEKYVPVFGGLDKKLAQKIGREMPGLNVTQTDVEDLIYLCADESGRVPDSSLRHLLSVNKRFDCCAAESHLLYLLGRPTPPLGLSHERSPAAEFYEYCEARLKTWQRQQEASKAVG